MIAAIRISGMINVPRWTQETLHRLRLRKKYSLVLIKPTKENIKLLKQVRNYVAFGIVDKQTLSELISKRALLIDKKKKINVAEILASVEKFKFEEAGIKPFFRLHSPRGGIDAKKHFGVDKGVLGDNKENINALIRRML